MTLEEAIKTAIDYETKIKTLYQTSADKASNRAGQRVFQALAGDEQHHIEYLMSRLKQWRQTGQLTAERLDTGIPAAKTILQSLKKLQDKMAGKARKDEKRMLSKALAVEVETSNFYREMVDQMDGEGRRMFARFLEIEAGHIDMVQAELDYISNTGYWFDVKEFDMEEL